MRLNIKTRAREPSVLFRDTRALPKPNQVHIIGRRVGVFVVIEGKRGNGARILPIVVLGMAIGVRKNPAFAVGAGRKIEKTILLHLNAKIWPAYAVRVHVRKKKKTIG